MRSKLGILAMVGIEVLGVSYSRCVESQDLPDQSNPAFRQIPGELGLNVFGLSLHTSGDGGLNGVNPGVGLRYAFWRPAPDWTVFADTSVYYDSRRHWAKYIALETAYRFAESWSVGIGVGYAQSQSYNHGTPFFAPIAGVAFEYRRITFNAVLLPSESSNSKVQGVAFFVTVPLTRRD